jgi:hypothetical protein
MDNPNRSIADQVAALEAAREAAEDEVTELRSAIEKARGFLTAVLDGRAEVQDFDPAEQTSAPVASAVTADEPKPRSPLVDAAVLRILHDSPTGGVAMRVSTITSHLTQTEGFGGVDGRAVSQSLQRLHKANLGTVAVRPTTPKGYWIAADLRGMRPSEQPTENGTQAGHHVAEEPEDDASALEEAGVVAGDADPADYGWR